MKTEREKLIEELEPKLQQWFDDSQYDRSESFASFVATFILEREKRKSPLVELEEKEVMNFLVEVLPNKPDLFGFSYILAKGICLKFGVQKPGLVELDEKEICELLNAHINYELKTVKLTPLTIFHHINKLSSRISKDIFSKFGVRKPCVAPSEDELFELSKSFNLQNDIIYFIRSIRNLLIEKE